ncbi:MAG TPA: VWA domain-containing protein [Gemmatimonadales bacterium]|nr:VWA domain-containing protein [Gemmatimonadales bacterium]
MIDLVQPSALLLLLVLPALWLLGRLARSDQARAVRRFGDPGLLGRSSPLPGPARPSWRNVLRWAGLGALIVALARPQWGNVPRALARTGRDLVVALDLSRSMRTRDVGQSRLELAKRLAWDLAAAHRGDRIGLVIFGDAGFLQLPPTSDLAAFRLFLDRASFDEIGDPSTNIAAGLAVAERSLRREGTVVGSRGVILLSDGERSEGALDPILEVFRRSRVPVFAVGVGTVVGGRVPGDSGSPLGPWHLDDIGRPVVSRLDEASLQKIALESGGAYARWDDPAALDRLKQSVGNLETRAVSAEEQQEPAERYQWPLGLGIMLLVTEALLAGSRARRPERRSLPKRSARPPLAAAGASVVALLLTQSCSSANRELTRGRQLYDQGKYLEAYQAYENVINQQGGPAVRYNAGNALYRLKHYSDASKIWREAAGGGDREVRERSFYNMGNAFVLAAEDANFLSGYLERSLDAYEEALVLDPTDRDAKWNLEIALKRRGDPGQEGSPNGGRADFGPGGHNEGYEGTRESAVGAMAGGGTGGDAGESVRELTPEEARALLDQVERQQLETHQGRPAGSEGSHGRDW